LSAAFVDVAGLTGPAEIPVTIARLAKEAGVLAGPERLLAYFPDFTGLRLPLKGDLVNWFKRIDRASKETNALVLASGDPNFYGLAQKLLLYIDPQRTRLWPGPTMIQLAFARIKRTWAKAEVVSIHGRSGLRELFSAAYRAGQSGEDLAVYTDPQNGPAEIAEALLERGQSHFKMTVFEDLSTEKEKIGEYSLNEAKAINFSPLNLVTLRTSQKPERVILGSPEEAYDPEGGLITKKEIRVAALGLLSFTGDETFWDIGAGCGSVSVEAARLLPFGELWALEKNPVRLARVIANQKRFGLAHLSALEGKAPKDLRRLPDPDRVFIGGAGKDLPEILEITLDRLKPGGIVVVSAIDPSRFAQTVEILSPNDTPDAIQVVVARSQPLRRGYYLKAHNPVWLVRGFAPGKNSENNSDQNPKANKPKIKEKIDHGPFWPKTN
jgi:precorrin-6Y C5,15-methyltransferase (decarboxylating)